MSVSRKVPAFNVRSMHVLIHGLDLYTHRVGPSRMFCARYESVLNMIVQAAIAGTFANRITAAWPERGELSLKQGVANTGVLLPPGVK